MAEPAASTTTPAHPALCESTLPNYHPPSVVSACATLVGALSFEAASLLPPFASFLRESFRLMSANTGKARCRLQSAGRRSSCCRASAPAILNERCRFCDRPDRPAELLHAVIAFGAGGGASARSSQWPRKSVALRLPNAQFGERVPAIKSGSSPTSARNAPAKVL